MAVRQIWRVLAPVAVAAFMLAGCTVKNPDVTKPIDSGEPYRRSTPLHLTDCYAWSVTVPIPQAVAPGSHPDGWGPAQKLFASVQMSGYRCQRVSLAGFERGPISLIIDSHTKAEFPTKCVEDESRASPLTQSLILSSLWIDNRELVHFLNETFGIPAYYTGIGITEGGPMDQLKLNQWAWGDGRPSTLIIADDVRYEDHPSMVNNFYWPVGDGIGSLKLVGKGLASAGPIYNRPAEGDFRPPMLLASVAAGHHADLSAQWYPLLSPEGTFTFFKDRFCEEPLEP